MYNSNPQNKLKGQISQTADKNKAQSDKPIDAKGAMPPKPKLGASPVKDEKLNTTVPKHPEDKESNNKPVEKPSGFKKLMMDRIAGNTTSAQSKTDSNPDAKTDKPDLNQPDTTGPDTRKGPDKKVPTKKPSTPQPTSKSIPKTNFKMPNIGASKVKMPKFR